MNTNQIMAAEYRKSAKSYTDEELLDILPIQLSTLKQALIDRVNGKYHNHTCILYYNSPIGLMISPIINFKQFHVEDFKKHLSEGELFEDELEDQAAGRETKYTSKGWNMSRCHKSLAITALNLLEPVEYVLNQLVRDSYKKPSFIASDRFDGSPSEKMNEINHVADAAYVR